MRHPSEEITPAILDRISTEVREIARQAVMATMTPKIYLQALSCWEH
jgi:hypothetical protein